MFSNLPVDIRGPVSPINGDFAPGFHCWVSISDEDFLESSQAVQGLFSFFVSETTNFLPCPKTIIMASTYFCVQELKEHLLC